MTAYSNLNEQQRTRMAQLIGYVAGRTTGNQMAFAVVDAALKTPAHPLVEQVNKIVKSIR